MNFWGGLLRPRDSAGRESRTLAIVGLSWLLMSMRFALGGLEASLGDFRFEIGVTPMVDYGAAVAAVLAVWVGREWVRNERHAKP